MGFLANSSAAAPETCGVAIDVPDFRPYEVPRTVERMEDPGAPRSTEVSPQFEKLERVSELVVEATEMRFGLS